LIKNKKLYIFLGKK